MHYFFTIKKVVQSVDKRVDKLNLSSPYLHLTIFFAQYKCSYTKHHRQISIYLTLNGAIIPFRVLLYSCFPLLLASVSGPTVPKEKKGKILFSVLFLRYFRRVPYFFLFFLSLSHAYVIGSFALNGAEKGKSGGERSAFFKTACVRACCLVYGLIA